MKQQRQKLFLVKDAARWGKAAGFQTQRVAVESAFIIMNVSTG